jgi:hypothetical protein
MDLNILHPVILSSSHLIIRSFSREVKMQHMNRWVIIVVLSLIVASLQLTACNSGKTPNAASEKPALIERIEGTELNRVVLSAKAAQRLDIQTAPVREEEVDGAQRKVIPYSAVIYDLRGDTWAYTSPEPLTFVRQPIAIDYIEGDLAFLTEGPEVGVEVATVGVAELYGADTGVGK